MDTESIMQKIREFEERHGGDSFKLEPDVDDEPAEEIQHHTILIFSCKLPEVFHTILIPWYTTGFQ